jgi:ectoine hydroxylase-related dioxygenase (phytanoyl-CoA dioxygenase family)
MSWTKEIARAGVGIATGVLSRDEVRAIASALDAADLDRRRAGARHLLSHPVVRRVAEDDRVLGIARECLGVEAIPFRATLFDKSARANWLIAWHQDTALPLREQRDVPGWGPWSIKSGVVYAHAPASALSRVIALRLQLDDSHADNGPLRVLPGTHARGLLSDDDAARLSGEIAPMECLVPAGGVIAMRPLLLHSSSKARTEDPRRVLHIEYADSLAIGEGLELAIC